LKDVLAIVVDDNFATVVDDRGSTLIPPSLLQFADTFAHDMDSTLSINVTVVKGRVLTPQTMFITLGDPAEYLDAAGRQTSEGYSIIVNSTGIVISGASPLGAWWGSRTLLQQALLNNGSLPYGSGSDSPGWGTRGVMLDVGRHFYPKEFIIEMCSYMSYFKMNVFHLHLSDNLQNSANYTREQSLNVYSRFRLWSDSPELAGLNLYKNESFTREDFDEIQSSCAARGVTILPEIEAPGHALVIVQWKPQLGYSTDLSLLNISHPETIPTMKTIWKTFLPWFKTKVVSIGADEYRGPEDQYNIFVNAMADYIYSSSGKSIRIWGTFPPIYTPGYENIYGNVSIQHWEYFEDNPLIDYMHNNYSVVNSNDDFYIVNKWGGYPNFIDM
jgi:hexosaminidase